MNEPYNLSKILKHISQHDLLTMISKHINAFYDLADRMDIETEGLLDKYKQTDDWLLFEYKYQSLICAFYISLKQPSYIIVGKNRNYLNVDDILNEMTLYNTFKDKFILFKHNNKRDALVSSNDIIYVASTKDDDILDISKHFAKHYQASIEVIDLNTDDLTEDIETLLNYHSDLKHYYKI